MRTTSSSCADSRAAVVIVVARRCIPGLPTSCRSVHGSAMSSWSAPPRTARRLIRGADSAAPRPSSRPNDKRRRPRVLAVFVREHRASQGVRPPAARHGGLRRGYARGVLGIAASDRCFSAAKLFFAYGLGNAMYFPWPSARPASCGRAAPAGGRVRRHRTLAADAVLLACRPLRHAARAPRRGREFDLSSIRLRRVGGRGAAAGRVRPLQVSDSVSRFSTASVRPRSCTSSSPTGAAASARARAGYRARDTRQNSWTRMARRSHGGEVGSLLIRGDSTCAFYWNRHELTKDTIEGHWIRTGDHYYQDEDGYYWFTGRSDDMLKVGGIWVSPTELEQRSWNTRRCSHAAWSGDPIRTAWSKPLAYVVPRADIDPTPALAAELQQFARTRLAEYKRPRWVEFVEALPTTATGKVQRFKLRERASQHETTDTRMACGTLRHGSHSPSRRAQADRDPARGGRHVPSPRLSRRERGSDCPRAEHGAR